MSSIRNLAAQHVGRRVVVHSEYGMHTGILHHMDERGMYLHSARAIQVSGVNRADFVPLDERDNSLDATEAFFPFFFIPWLAAWALWPWGGWWW